MSKATYTVVVNWSGSGVLENTFYAPWFSLDPGTDEDVTSVTRGTPGLHMTRGRDQIRVLTPPMAGVFDAELDNQARTYSPENTSSALYGLLLPGRPVQVRASFGGTDYYLWTGFLDDIPQHPERGRRSVSIPAFGSLSKLAGKTISTALYSSIRTDEALGYLLDAAGWGPTDRVLDTGATTLDWWWLANEDALQAAFALLNTEGPGAALYEDAQGRIVFESRHYRLTTTRSTASQATISDAAEPRHAEPMSYNPGLKDIINTVHLTTKTRAAQSLGAVWTLGQTVTLAANETRKYTATASDPFTGAITPASGTDYTVTSGSLASVSLNRTSGSDVTITLTAGVSGATVTGLQLRAQSVTVQNTVEVANTIDTTTSIGRYGQQVYTYDIRAEIDVNTAQDLANAIVGRYAEPRPIVIITLNNGTDSRLTQILAREISDRITIAETQTGLNSDFYIEFIEHTVDEAGLHHVAQFGCEKALTADYFIFGTSVFGTGIFGY